MAITKQEYQKEKLILKKVSKLLNNTLDELQKEVNIKEENLIEFKKLMWQDSSSFDEGEILQTKMATNDEESKLLQKQKYYKRLSRIKSKPYFASIVYEDLSDHSILNIYIALTYLKDTKLNNILYDWRSPICSLFYDFETGPCTYTSPGGINRGNLLRKRQYKIENNTLISVFDNSINIEDDILQEVLSEESSEKMKNVVNTIQQEQNQVIRNLEDDNLIVQGIAGSGKTSVALHRIAFLLYRIKNLTSNNILIFSPNNIFTEYISNVLPELGEENTLQTTFNDYLTFFLDEYKDIETFTDFISRYYSNNETDIELVRYKQSDDIITDMNNFLEHVISNAFFEQDIQEDSIRKMTKGDLNEMLHNKYDRMPLFERLDEMAEKISSNFYKGSNKKVKSIKKKLEKSLNQKEDYKKIYEHFFTSEYSKIKLTKNQLKQYIEKDTLNYDDALLFAYLKGKLKGFTYEANIKQVVIDEAQDYNKLQYIIISNIFKKASFTILGDINQNINPYYKYTSLDELKNILNGSTIYLELLKTYRSSPEIVEYTNKILNLNHVNAIRRNNNKPVVIKNKVINLKETLIEDIKLLQENYISTAIITKDNKEAIKIFNLIKEEINVSLIDDASKKFKRDLIIIPAYLSKGLEFDSVIIYNDRLNSYKRNERNLLYVACTRAQHELHIYN